MPARRPGRLPNPLGALDTSHCTEEVAALFRGFFAAKSEHDTAAMMSYFSTAATVYIDACLGVALTRWQAVRAEFATFAKLPAAAVSYPLRIVGGTRSAAIEFVDTPAFFGQEIRAPSTVTFSGRGRSPAGSTTGTAAAP